MFYVYILINQINAKFYIGKTNNIKRRWNEHKKIANGGKEKYDKNFRVVHTAIKKYGQNNFKLIELEKIENEQDAFEAERFWIEYFESYRKNIGYNESFGGEGTGSGDKHPLYGKTPSEETKKKLRKSRIGKKPMLGKIHTEETKIKMSKSKLGPCNAMFGKTHSDETKNLISQIKLNDTTNKGENHFLSKLTNNQVSEIRKLFTTENYRKSDLAKAYNVSWDVIHNIILYRTYKIIPCDDT